MKTVLCYGDSNTYGYDPSTRGRYDSGIRWTGRLQELLGPEYRVVEEGCNGRTTVRDDPEEPWKNGLPYLRPCLNTHKPVDIVILMLGSNDLKRCFGASARQIADGAGQLAGVIRSFTREKQGFVPEILLVSPPAIGEGITGSPFRISFDADAVPRSRQFPAEYRRAAEENGCVFVNAADHAEASPLDSLHLTAESHARLAEAFAETILRLGTDRKE